MGIIRKVFEALYHCAFFIPYTRYRRWIEVLMGVFLWGNVLVITVAFAKLLARHGVEIEPIPWIPVIFVP